jgi:hypothetical protein
MLSRRRFVAAAAGLLAVSGRSKWLAAASATPITVYKSRSCGCCAKWVEHLEAEGFDPRVHDEEEMDRIKDELGVPQAVRSCHTAVAGKYLIEGHVPAADIRKLLRQQPAVAGLAVPGMPGGTPGMAALGAKPTGFDVVAFQSSGKTEVFARY